MEITKIGSKPSVKGSQDWFSGSVRIDPLFDANGARRAAAAIVTFEPGARTAWHTHPLGQTIIITAGCGWVQKKAVPWKKYFPAMWYGLNPMKNTGMVPLLPMA